MELVEGEDLSALIARGPIALPDALPIAKQIADALEAAHEQGIIHRDLKPANIKVRADGTVKVLDFGLAKAMDPAGASSASASALANSPTLTSPAMTQMGMILGTAAYMSPEQARGRAVDKRADIWAFGCVLFEMLTGQRAFPGEDVTDTLAAVVRAEPDWSAHSGRPLADAARVPEALPPEGSEAARRRHPRRAPRARGRVRRRGSRRRPAPHRRSLVATRASRRVGAGRDRDAPCDGSLAPVPAGAASGRDARAVQRCRRPSRRVRSAFAPFDVTPDGQMIAFVARGRRRCATHIRPAPRCGGRAGRRRTRMARVRSVLGSRWPVARLRTKRADCIASALDGSAPRLLCSVPGAAFAGGTWSARGVIVFAAREMAPCCRCPTRAGRRRR